MNFEEVEQMVINWGYDRRLYHNYKRLPQIAKLTEEVSELITAINNQEFEKIDDAIGDIMVVLTHIALINGSTLPTCYEKAYDIIKDRKGETIHGIFVKEG